jgi:hypothetical protein
MKRLLLALTVAMLVGKTRTISFNRDSVGSAPRDWAVAMTHEGGAPKWEIVQDGNARVLAQTSEDQTAGRFPVSIYQKARFVDGRVSVRFKPVKGERDQAAGIVWRYQDQDNYYIVRANALEDNVVLYKVEGGKRISLEPKGTPSKTYGVKQRVPKLTWSTLAVEFRGAAFQVFFDGVKIMDVIDSTFNNAGNAGLWTKADSVTYFDDFRFERTK